MQLSQAQINEVFGRFDYTNLMFDWAEAVFTGHTDHQSDFAIDIAGEIMRILQLPESETFDCTDITPVLLHAETIKHDGEPQLKVVTGVYIGREHGTMIQFDAITF